MITQFEVQSIPYTDDQIDEFHEVFAFFDRDQTGRIGIDALGLLMRSAGFNPSVSTIKQFQQDYQTNGIDQITFQQFLQLLIHFTNVIDDEIDIIEAFRVFDKEGQGFITKEELTHIMTHLGEKLSIEEVEEMMHDADIYCDGKIRYEEFVQIMTQLY